MSQDYLPENYVFLCKKGLLFLNEVIMLYMMLFIGYSQDVDEILEVLRQVHKLEEVDAV